ncbi:MAG TPA: hypothetical protein VFL47_10640 [Flavisolibacter sp.]|nr:hypothetical protein [Flavisolibacter sp.]
MEKQRSSSEKGPRGIAAMPSERQHEIASNGGENARQQGEAHEWDPPETREAGKKGRQVSGKRRSARTENDGSDHFL